ncbi:hypothetical protein BRD04_06160 [Halobacteriales archaeon QS_9_67_17]|nr:MAG: hypothetical protein BRD04_06160 [Halobacteriales archaeon QS_9_67_17]
MRGQANLPALAVALLVVTTTAGLGFSLADDAFAGASRDTDEARTAALAERLVDARSPLTERANVLAAGAVTGLDAATLASDFPVVADAAFRVRLDDQTLAERGDPRGGATVERIVLVQSRERVTVTPPLSTNRTTLPRRTERVTVDIDPSPGTTVTTVRANDRVVLRNPNGLAGQYDVSVSRYATVTLDFAADGPLRQGDVTVTYRPSQTTKATLSVTVDA